MVRWRDNSHIMVAWSNRAQNHSVLTLCNAYSTDCQLVSYVENQHLATVLIGRITGLVGRSVRPFVRLSRTDFLTQNKKYMKTIISVNVFQRRSNMCANYCRGQRSGLGSGLRSAVR